MIGSRWAELPGVQSCLKLWLEAQAGAENLPLALAPLLLQQAAPFCSINSWRAGSCYLLCRRCSLPSWQWNTFPASQKTSILALKGRSESCKDRHALGDTSSRITDGKVAKCQRSSVVFWGLGTFTMTWKSCVQKTQSIMYHKQVI